MHQCFTIRLERSGVRTPGIQGTEEVRAELSGRMQHVHLTRSQRQQIISLFCPILSPPCQNVCEGRRLQERLENTYIPPSLFLSACSSWILVMSCVTLYLHIHAHMSGIREDHVLTPPLLLGRGDWQDIAMRRPTTLDIRGLTQASKCVDDSV